MLRTLRPSPAMVVALIALFVAVGGTAGAALVVTSSNIRNGTIRGKDVHRRTLRGKNVKKNTLGRNEVKESSLGKVPSAGSADVAVNAANATTLGGAPPSSFQRAGLPPFHSATPANGWDSVSGSPPGFWMDGDGVVHLQGSVGTLGGSPPSSNIPFTLPAGFRPKFTHGFPISCAGGVGHGAVDEQGRVFVISLSGNQCEVAAELDGMAFRTDK